MIMVIGVTRMSMHPFTSEISTACRSHDLVEEEFRILRMLSSDTGSKEERVLLLLLGLVAGTGTDDCATLIFIILSLKKCPKILAKSVGLI